MTDDTYMDETDRYDGSTRRRFLAAGAAGTVGLLAGCATAPGGDDGDGSTDENSLVGQSPPWYGSGPGSFEARDPPEGTSIEEMPDLAGTLTLYSGRGEGLVGDLIGYFEEYYDDFEVEETYGTAASLANRINTEGGNTPADVFYSVNAGALGQVQSNGHTEALTDETTSLVPAEFRADDGAWIGTSGRARTVPFNTETLSEGDVPDDVMSFPDLTGYEGEIGWAPVYSSFQGFITAMIAIEGEEATREWLNGMQDLGVQQYGDEFAVSQAVADGELALGFANHYYIQRVLAGRPDAPISTAFTSGDAGSVFNVAGAARLSASDQPELADAFVRHLLSAEAQEYFAIRTFEYPLVEGVDPIGDLPPISELDVPDIDLSQLSDLDRTVDILTDEGIL